MSGINYVTNEYVSYTRRNHQVSTRCDGAWGLNDAWMMSLRNSVMNELCHEWTNHEWIRIIYTQKSRRLDLAERRIRTRSWMNHVTNGLCHEWIVLRMNTYHPYVRIIKSRPGGTAHQDSIMNEFCYEEIISRMNHVTNESISNELWHECIMSRMNYVTNELCHEWIRIIHTQELWNLDPAEQHKRTRLRLKQPCWGKIRWSRFYSYGCIHTCVYIHACVCIHVEDRTGCIFMAVYIHVYTYMCIHTRMCMHTCWGSSRWYTYESMNIIV